MLLLLAIPFFIYAGELMGRGSVARRLVDVVRAGVGHMPGALGVTTIGTSTIFGATSGSSAARRLPAGALPALADAVAERHEPEHAPDRRAAIIEFCSEIVPDPTAFRGAACGRQG